MKDDLQYFLSCLSAARRFPRPASEAWTDLIQRISTPGQITQIDAGTFSYFLEVIPPHFQSNDFFAFAEGREEMRLFWRDSDGNYWCRQLDWQETVTFCRLAGIPLPH